MGVKKKKSRVRVGVTVGISRIEAELCGVDMQFLKISADLPLVGAVIGAVRFRNGVWFLIIGTELPEAGVVHTLTCPSLIWYFQKTCGCWVTEISNFLWTGGTSKELKQLSDMCDTPKKSS